MAIHDREDEYNATRGAPLLSEAMPDTFDRLLGLLHGFAHTKPSLVQIVPVLGVGGAETFLVQTYRQPDEGDTIFLHHVTRTGTVRIAIPPRVSQLIARQREQLTSKNRSASAKAVAQARKDRGEQPAFMRKKAAKKKS